MVLVALLYRTVSAANESGRFIDRHAHKLDVTTSASYQNLHCCSEMQKHVNTKMLVTTASAQEEKGNHQHSDETKRKQEN